jgi:hypothetical protein
VLSTPWNAEQLERICRSRELEIASRRVDGTLRPSLPIWVVCADGGVYVRTWYRRTTGWFGRVIAVPEARIQVPGLGADVSVVDVGGALELRASVDGAYRAKYGPAGHQSMITDEAAATTLRLDPR